MDDNTPPTCPYVTGECEYPHDCPDCSTVTVADKWAAFFAQQRADFNKAMNRDENGRPL